MKLSQLFFCGDTHWNHKNILDYCWRAFGSVKEHDEALIVNWNSKVGKQDTVYHLGDVGFGSPKFVAHILEQLNGTIYLIRGNHDKSMRKEAIIPGKVIDLGSYYELSIQDPEMDIKFKIVLCHYPFLTWNKSHFGAWHLHGHCHSTIDSPGLARLDVGVDSAYKFLGSYSPFSYQEVKDVFTRRLMKHD